MPKCDCPACLEIAVRRASLLGPGLPTPCSICEGSGLRPADGPGREPPADPCCPGCAGLGFIFI